MFLGMTIDDFTAAKVRSGLYDFAIDTAKLCAALSVILGLLWAIASYSLQAYIDLPDRMAARSGMVSEELAGLSSRISSLENEVLKISPPDPPVIQFRYSATAIPDEIRPGGEMVILYMIKRNKACEGEVTVRFWSMRDREYDPQFTRTMPAARTPMMSGFAMWTLRLRLPEDIKPGIWAYQPDMKCDGDWGDPVPPAVFRVLPPEQVVLPPEQGQ